MVRFSVCVSHPVHSLSAFLAFRLPLYYPIKTLFLLYLALPQTSGSAWLYQTQLRPFFAAHETEIDSLLAKLKSSLYAQCQKLIRRGWEQLSGTIAQGQAAPAGPSPLDEQGGGRAEETAGGPAQLVAGLWTTYGPGILAGGTALLTRAQASAAQAAAADDAQFATVGRGAARRPSAAERRRQIEAELASLEQDNGYDVASAPGSPALGMGRSTFEEVEVPSDMEGEDGARGARGQARGTWFG